MAASGTRVKVRLAGRCQRRHTQIEDKCQEINPSEKQWHDDNISRGCSGGGGGAAAGGGEKTPRHQHHDGSEDNLHLCQDENVCYNLVPPDGGWGWMVVLGTFIITFLLPMLGPCFGVLFSGYLLGEGSSSTTAAWIFNLQCFLWFTSGLLTRPLTQEFGWRSLGMSGSLLASVGLMISALSPNPSFLFFSFSIMTGCGGGLVTCQCFTILPHYFQRLRGFTNAIMMSGISLGQFVGPPVARYLQDNFGFRGATLIIGAIMLNSCIGASFFHPYEWHQKMVLVEEEPKEEVPALSTKIKEQFLALFTKTKVAGSPHLPHELVQSPSESSFFGSIGEGECDGDFAAKPRLLGGSRQSSRYNSKFSLSSMDVGSLAVLPMDDEQKKADRETQKARDVILLVRVVKSTLKDIGALKSLRVSIFCFGAMMSINGFLNFIMMVPFAMLEAGFSKDTSAWCVSVSAGCNLMARFVVSLLSDFPCFNKRLTYMYLFGFVLIASSIWAFTVLDTVEWLLVAMAVYGMGVGATMGIYSLVIIDVMGLERLSSVFGASSFCVAIGFICIGPLIGFIRDATQSYAVSMRILVGMLLAGLVAWMFMSVAERIDRRREAAKTKEEAPLET